MMRIFVGLWRLSPALLITAIVSAPFALGWLVAGGTGAVVGGLLEGAVFVGFMAWEAGA